MKRVVNLALVLSLLGAASALAAMKGSADVVKAAPKKTALTAAAGARISFEVGVDIAPRWHLYAHGDTNFIGVDLVPDENFPLEGFSAVYPAGHQGEFFGEKVWMIDGKQVIKAEAKVPDALAKGVHRLKLGLTVQACDDKTCLAPASLPLELKLTVE